MSGLQQYVAEMDAGTVKLDDATEASLKTRPLTEREKAIILSGQENLVRAVAAGETPIEDVKLELSPDLVQKMASTA